MINLKILCIFFSIKEIVLILLIFTMTMAVFTKEPYPINIYTEKLIEKVIFYGICFQRVWDVR